jgi:hypothetical protein
MDPIVIESIAAVLLPLLIAVVKKQSWSATVNALIAVGVYVIAGVASVALQAEPFDLSNIVPSVATFTVGGTVAYQLFWKNWGDPQIQENVLP